MKVEHKQLPDLLPIAKMRVVAESAAVALLAALLVWKGICAGWRTVGSDFPQYYVVARLILERCNLDRMYDWIWLQRMADHFGIVHQLIGFEDSTPFSALPLLPMAWLSGLAAKRVWIAVNVLLLVATVRLLSRVSRVTLIRAWLIALLAFIPLRNSFILGQMHLLVLAFLAAAWWFHMRGKQASSGACIAIAAALKMYPICFCIYFAAKRRWRAMATAIAVFACCALLCLAVFGRTATSFYLWQQLPRTLLGEGIHPFLPSSTSAVTLFHRLFLFEPELNPHPLVSSPLLYAILYPLWPVSLMALVFMRIRYQFMSDDRETLDWSAFLCLLLFMSPAPSTYHFVALIAAAIPTYAILSRKSSKPAAFFLALYAIAGNAWNIKTGYALPPALTAILIPKLYAGLALIFFYSTIIRRLESRRTHTSVTSLLAPIERRVKAQHKTAAVIITALVAGWFLQAGNALRHWNSLVRESSRKMQPFGAGWMRTSPQLTSAGLYYVAMLDDGYRVMRDGSSIDRTSFNDQLTFAAAPNGNDLWVETAGAQGSQIDETKSDGKRIPGCMFDNAESPALSLDGARLAFIREERGHGSLWIADPANCASQPGSASAAKITPPDLDVRSVSGFSDGQFLVGANTADGPSVFLATRTNRLQLILHANLILGAQASYPGSELMVAGELVHQRWQVVTLNLANLNTRQLTFADCNSGSPTWKDARTVIYATDCERGRGLTTLAQVNLSN